MSWIITLAIAANLANCLKVGIVSDMHINLDYDVQGGDDDNCTSSIEGQEMAPLARFDCDPSSTLVDYMLTRFTESFGSVDVLLVTGDHVAHELAPDLGEATKSDADKVQANLQATSDMVKKHFPDTLVLTALGNNDGYHSQAIDDNHSEPYYEFLYDLWIEGFAGNAEIVESTKDTFLSAGYYRADVSDTVSVLVLNNEYFDKDSDDSVYGSEPTEQLDWLEAQLSAASSEGRKFIIIGHVYAGVRYKDKEMWHSEYASRYFQILRDLHDSVIIEVMGHDHYADLRYHSSHNVPDMEDTDVKFDFHNMLIAPGVTPNKGQNPGVAMFEVSSDGVPSNLTFEFIDLVPTMGKSAPLSYSELDFLSLAMQDFGVTAITASALSDFRKELEDDKDMALDYLTRKMGFNSSSEAETQMAYSIYEDKDLITTGKQKTGEFICQMHKNIGTDEYTDCTKSANSARDFDPIDRISSSEPLFLR